MLCQHRITPTSAEVAKALRANATRLDPDKYALADLDKVVEHFEDMLVDVFYSTPRPAAKLLEQAARAAFVVEPMVAQLFGQRLSAAVSYCRTKARQSTSGAKLHPSVLNVARVLKKVGDSGAMEQLGFKARLLSLPVQEPQKVEEQDSLEKQDQEQLQPQLPSTSSKATRAEIMSLYGVSSSSCSSSKKPRLLQRVPTVQSSQEVMSSQEDQGVQFDQGCGVEPAAALGPCLPAFSAVQAQYFDSSRKGVVRLCGDDIVEAKMVAGPDGFAVACFGKEEFETEMPNLLLEASKPVMKRPSVEKTCSFTPGISSCCPRSICWRGGRA